MIEALGSLKVFSEVPLREDLGLWFQLQDGGEPSLIVGFKVKGAFHEAVRLKWVGSWFIVTRTQLPNWEGQCLVDVRDSHRPGSVPDTTRILPESVAWAVSNLGEHASGYVDEFRKNKEEYRFFVEAVSSGLDDLRPAILALGSEWLARRYAGVEASVSAASSRISFFHVLKVMLS